MESIVKELSIVIPCLNEEKTLPIVIKKAQNSVARLEVDGEIIISDNGSVDNSVEIASRLGVRVVHCAKRGYGNALRCGFENANGKFLIMGDADDSYDFEKIDNFLKYLREGNEIVMGTRLRGRIEKGAMPFLHRYLGTPVLTFIINRLFGTKISDCNCGMRGLTAEIFRKLKLESSGMEFASEMLIKAGILRIKIKEIPIVLHKDRRGKSSHLHTWRDGWRHLKFILLYAPDFVFTWPASLFFLSGTALMALQVNGPFTWGNIYMGIHTMILGLTLSIFGISIFQMGSIIKIFSVQNDYYKNNKPMKWLKKITIERGLIFGGIIFFIGFFLDVAVLVKWAENDFKDIFMPQAVIFGLYFMLIGLFLAFFSFFLAIMKKKED
jgi:glycosyltransferase involved in cell wall biosynthesis